MIVVWSPDKERGKFSGINVIKKQFSLHKPSFRTKHDFTVDNNAQRLMLPISPIGKIPRALHERNSSYIRREGSESERYANPLAGTRKKPEKLYLL